MFIFLDVNILPEILPDVTYKLINTGFFPTLDTDLLLAHSLSNGRTVLPTHPETPETLLSFRTSNTDGAASSSLMYTFLSMFILYRPYDNLIVPAYSCPHKVVAVS